jgi:hypothetical protein
MSQDLKTFVLNNKKFIKIKDGETFRGIYRGHQIGRSRFDPEKEIVSYGFWQPGMDEGKIARWEAGSTAVAEAMMKISVGEEVEIHRTGSGTNDTKYTVMPISAEVPVIAAKKK